MILKNCTFYNEVFEKEFGDIKIQNGVIKEIGYFNEDGVDMNGKIILPGFVDIHIHGGNGGDFCDCDKSSLDKITSYLAKRGVTSCLATTMTLPVDRLVKIAEFTADYAKNQVTGSKIMGINLEGPYISMAKKGAQNGDFVAAGNAQDVKKIYDESGGMVKIITVAPEAFESDEFIKKVSEFCTVSIGHSSADADECAKAVDCGVSHATHLYNAMTPMTHRNAGIVGTVLDREKVTCELICDTEHVCPVVLRNTFKILGQDRAVAISDSMRGAGLGTGEFELGGQTVYVKDGYKVAKLEDGTIAASITNLFVEFKNLLEIGIDFKTALKACTINPARVIKEDDKIGSVAVNKCADLIVCDENLNIEEVYIDGTRA